MRIRIITILSLCFVFSIQALNAQTVRYKATYIKTVEFYKGKWEGKSTFDINNTVNFSIYYDYDNLLWSMYFPEENRTFNFKVLEIDEVRIDKEGNISTRYITINEDNERIDLSTIYYPNKGYFIGGVFNEKAKEGYTFYME